MTSLQSARGRRLTTTWPLPSHLQDVVMGLPHSHVKIGLFRRSHAPAPVRGTPSNPNEPARAASRGAEPEKTASQRLKKQRITPPPQRLDASPPGPGPPVTRPALALPRREP